MIPRYIILLRPTTPLRNPKVVDKAISKFLKNKNYDSLVSVHKMNEPVHKKFFIKKNRLVPVISGFTNDQANEPRQGLPASYTANGYLDIIKTKNIIYKKKYLGERCLPFVLPKAIDIDDSLDLAFANYLADKNYSYV